MRLALAQYAPELCLSPFFPQFPGREVSQYLMSADSEYIRQFQTTCRRLTLAASPNVYLQQGENRFDASLMIDSNGEILGISTMVHIAQLPGFYERDYYTPSDTGFHVYETPLGSVGVVVCFDRHFPESIRTCALRGAQLIIIPTANLVSEPRDLFECELRAASLQNGVFIAMCNRVGKEGTATFCGSLLLLIQMGMSSSKQGVGRNWLSWILICHRLEFRNLGGHTSLCDALSCIGRNAQAIALSSTSGKLDGASSVHQPVYQEKHKSQLLAVRCCEFNW